MAQLYQSLIQTFHRELQHCQKIFIIFFLKTGISSCFFYLVFHFYPPPGCLQNSHLYPSFWGFFFQASILIFDKKRKIHIHHPHLIFLLTKSNICNWYNQQLHPSVQTCKYGQIINKYEGKMVGKIQQTKKKKKCPESLAIQSMSKSRGSQHVSHSTNTQLSY